jgi:hypothetical protein
MNQMPDANALRAKSSWPKAVTIIAVAAIVVSGALYAFQQMRELPMATMNKGAEIVKEIGGQAVKVARAFNAGTVREEFLSHASEVAGTSRFQFATLRQGEIFKREESGSVAWGLVPLPKVVVQAQAPVEYSYFLDFNGPWEFRGDGRTLTVLAPPILFNPPALDVSALKFYTLEGSIWRDEGPVREHLKDGLSEALKDRAGRNISLVRETGRRRFAEFVEKWLAEKFTDGRGMHVKVVFPDEERESMPEATR